MNMQPTVVSATTQLPMAMIVAALSAADQAAVYVEISSPELAELAGVEVSALRNLFKQIDAKREELKRPFLEGCRGVDNFFREALDKIKAADTAISAGLVSFNQRQRRIAEEAAAKARREAEERARIQREAAEREQAAARQRAADAMRQQRELDEQARKRQEELTAQAEAAAPEQIAEIAGQMVAIEAQQEAEAARIFRERLEAQQQEQAAAERAASASNAALVVPVAYRAPVQSAVGMRDHWIAEVVDFRALVKAVAADDSLLELLQVDQSALNKLAGALKGQMRIAGVRPVNDQRIASKRGKAAAA